MGNSMDDPLSRTFLALADPTRRAILAQIADGALSVNDIVAANSLPTTSAHELGHFLGNEHAYVRNNLMSYLRDDESMHPHIFLDAAQGARAQRTARALLAKGELGA